MIFTHFQELRFRYPKIKKLKFRWSIKEYWWEITVLPQTFIVWACLLYWGVVIAQPLAIDPYQGAYIILFS